MFSEFESIVEEQVPLAPHSWLKLGGNARYFATPENAEQLAGLVQEANASGLAVRMLGGGSNLLIRTGVVDALVVRNAGQLADIVIEGTSVTVGSAASLADLLSKTAESGLAGLEHLAGIPGTVGGAVVCNAAVSNGDIGSKVRRVWALTNDGTPQELDRSQLKFAFRQSNLDDRIVTKVELELEESEAEEVTRRLQSCWIVRRAAQPSAGSRVAQAFIEPSGYSISQLIDASGMRDASEGQANMTPEFPGFLTVNDEASAEEVISLTSRIARAVEVQSGIQLQPQLRIW